MNLRLYAANKHAWLIVPDCMVASQAAIDKYGTLMFQGVFDQDELGAQQLARIATAFDTASFAEIPNRLADKLLRSMKVPGA